ncbi:MAG: pyridoxal-phosphate dependent enzyme [Pseudomonadota bacterium]
MGTPVVSLPATFEGLPRVELATLPTPLMPLDRLSEELGGPRIWLKRDDLTGFALGGNKVRKLEYLLAEAQALGQKAVLTFGAVQSNHARQTAAACARLGLDCHLLLTRRVPWAHPGYERGGNRLLDELYGAAVTLVDLEDAWPAYDRLVTELGGVGAFCEIPAGGSSVLGTAGYVRAAAELVADFAAAGIAPARLYHASASAGTQAGLSYGLAALAAPVTVCGVNVYHPNSLRLRERLRTLQRGQIERFGPLPALPDFEIVGGYLGPGYGLPTPAERAAIALCARLEGVLFDPVYSGKALHALLDHVALGVFEGESDVVLLHSGGTAAWAVYDNDWD